ncbi:MAG: CapA family protein [Deltaproteobacteria bacterium]|nr:CapA family protein [Deltaproteobacteria bacterium]
MPFQKRNRLLNIFLGPFLWVWLALLLAIQALASEESLEDPNESLLALGPLSLEEQEASLKTENIVRLIFLGDIMVHSRQVTYAKTDQGYDFRKQFQDISPLFKNAMVIGNLETVFAGEKAKYTGFPAFNSPDSLAVALKELGVNVLTLANNHILDRRKAGALRTIQVLEEQGIFWTGIGTNTVLPNQPLILMYKDLKWAILNFTFCSNFPIPPYTPQEPEAFYLNQSTPQAVREGLTLAAKENPDVTIVLFHWGDEYHLSPSKYQTNLARVALENGADLIIGTHPHVLQPIQVIPRPEGTALVAYSLGNFVSGQRTLPRERAAVLAVDFVKSPQGGAKLLRASLAPTYISQACPEGKCTIQVLYAGTPLPRSVSLKREPIRSEGVPMEAWNQDFQRSDSLGWDYASRRGQKDKSWDRWIRSGRGEVIPTYFFPTYEARYFFSPVVISHFVPPSEAELQKAAQAGETIVDFLGAQPTPDEFGFYTLWDARSHWVLPESRRKAPH